MLKVTLKSVKRFYISLRTIIYIYQELQYLWTFLTSTLEKLLISLLETKVIQQYILSRY